MPLGVEASFLTGAFSATLFLAGFSIFLVFFGMAAFFGAAVTFLDYMVGFIVLDAALDGPLLGGVVTCFVYSNLVGAGWLSSALAAFSANLALVFS